MYHVPASACVREHRASPVRTPGICRTESASPCPMMRTPAFSPMHGTSIVAHPRCIRLTPSRQLADLFTSGTLDSSCSTLIGAWEALPSRLEAHTPKRMQCICGRAPRCCTRAPPLPRKCKSNMRIIAADASRNAPYAFCRAVCSWMKLGCGVDSEPQRWDEWLTDIAAFAPWSGGATMGIFALPNPSSLADLRLY
ncbi:hypothetical protein GY45DRAFT_751176 [Cubamyces sp. BRFM 1775]|nr:hypothetical protein GY45DRAFT_751176 [Cubamyces sp. BRFM 1775]